LMESSRSKRQVLILDCCFSGAFAKGMAAKGDAVNLQVQLGGQGRAVLTSSSATEYSFEHKESTLSVYTQYVVEGLRTGIADQNGDGMISVDELHEFAQAKVREVAPAMQPKIYAVEQGYKIIVAQAPMGDPKLEYRKQVKLLAQEDEGDFSFVNRAYLDDFQRSLGLSPDVAIAIETEELEPYRQRRAKVDRYRTVFEGAIAHSYPLNEGDRTGLQRFQQLLSLRDEDIVAIETPILTIKQFEYEQQQSAARQAEEQRQVEQQRQQVAQKHQHQQAQKQQQPEQAAQRIQPISPSSTPTQATPKPSQLQRPELYNFLASRHQPQKQKVYNFLDDLGHQRLLRSNRSKQEPTSPTITRQQFLKWTAFGGGGLVVALLGNQVIQSQKTPETVVVDDRGRIVKRVPVQAKFVSEDLGNEVVLEMAVIPAGDFLMGSAGNEESASGRETPQHRVKVPEFLMGKFAVTQAQWQQVAGLPKVKLDLNPDPSNFKGAKRPVEGVSWFKAVEFCDRLSVETGKTYRLPSEAEWEYACRAGTTTPFYFGETITSDLVNCNGTNPYGNAPKGENREQTTEVETFPPNGFGLYDMHGNVWEWCADPWHDNYQDAPTDGSVWTTNGNNEIRVLRGGSWNSDPVNCRSAYRINIFPRATFNPFGFRIVCSSPRTLT